MNGDVEIDATGDELAALDRLRRAVDDVIEHGLKDDPVDPALAKAYEKAQTFIERFGSPDLVRLTVIFLEHARAVSDAREKGLEDSAQVADEYESIADGLARDAHKKRNIQAFGDATASAGAAHAIAEEIRALKRK